MLFKIKQHRFLVDKVLIFTVVNTFVSKIKTMILGPARASVRHVLERLEAFKFSFICFAKSAAKRICIGTGLVLVIVWSATLLYAGFYHFYVPSASLIRPAHFKFRVCSSGSGLCSFPVANITLCTQSGAQGLGRGQQYRVVLELIVPDSAPNRDVGMFMVHGRMYNHSGDTIQESSRTASLKYQSDLVKSIQTFVLFPFYVTGLFSTIAKETQTLSIELFDDFWDDYYQPAVGVLLEIQSRQLTFYSAQLQFHAHYSKLKYYLYYYPVSSAVCGIVFNCLWLTVAFVLTWYRLGLEMMNGQQSRSAAVMDSHDIHWEVNGGWDISRSEEEEGEREIGYVQSFTITTSARQPETTENTEDRSAESMQNGSLIQPLTEAVSPKQADIPSTYSTNIQPFTVSIATARLTESVDGCTETDGNKKDARSVDDDGQLRHRVRHTQSD